MADYTQKMYADGVESLWIRREAKAVMEATKKLEEAIKSE